MLMSVMVMDKQKIPCLVGVTKGMELKPGSMGKPTPGNQGRNHQ